MSDATRPADGNPAERGVRTVAPVAAGVPGVVVPPASMRGLVVAGIAAALWPVLVVHACYLLSAAQGHVPWCNPYWDGCASISRAGRHGAAFFLFKAGMLPYATLLGLFWWVNHRWLVGLQGRGARWMLATGLVGVAFLVLYATFLGFDGRGYQLMRRYGINVYFGATFAAQVLLWWRLRSLAGPAALPAWLVGLLGRLAAAVLVLGAVFYAADMLGVDRDRLENAVEWVVALLMQATILVVVLGWRIGGLRLAIVTPASRAGADPSR